MQLVPHLINATMDFFQALKARLDGDYRFLTPLFKFDFAFANRFARGLAMADPSRVHPPNLLTRLWSNEIIREHLDRLPSADFIQEAVYRQLSASMTKIPMETDQMTSLQESLNHPSNPSSWVHVPFIFNAEMGKENQERNDMSHVEVSLAYQELTSASEDSPAPLSVDCSDLVGHKNGSSGRCTSLLLGECSEKRSMQSKQEDLYGIAGKC